MLDSILAIAFVLDSISIILKYMIKEEINAGSKWMIANKLTLNMFKSNVVVRNSKENKNDKSSENSGVKTRDLDSEKMLNILALLLTNLLLLVVVSKTW